MKLLAPQNEYRLLLDRKLTELSLYAKELCPDAEVEANTVPCEPFAKLRSDGELLRIRG